MDHLQHVVCVMVQVCCQAVAFFDQLSYLLHGKASSVESSSTSRSSQQSSITTTAVTQAGVMLATYE